MRNSLLKKRGLITRNSVFAVFIDFEVDITEKILKKRLIWDKRSQKWLDCNIIS